MAIVSRASLHLQIQHPQWLGARITWSDGMRLSLRHVGFMIASSAPDA